VVLILKKYSENLQPFKKYSTNVVFSVKPWPCYDSIYDDYMPVMKFSLHALKTYGFWCISRGWCWV